MVAAVVGFAPLSSSSSLLLLFAAIVPARSYHRQWTVRRRPAAGFAPFGAAVDHRSTTTRRPSSSVAPANRGNDGKDSFRAAEGRSTRRGTGSFPLALSLFPRPAATRSSSIAIMPEPTAPEPVLRRSGRRRATTTATATTPTALAAAGTAPAGEEEGNGAGNGTKNGSAGTSNMKRKRTNAKIRGDDGTANRKSKSGKGTKGSANPKESAKTTKTAKVTASPKGSRASPASAKSNSQQRSSGNGASSSHNREDTVAAVGSSGSGSGTTTTGAKAAAAADAAVGKAKAPKHQVLTERDPLPKLWTAEERAARTGDGSYTFKVASWNVAGIRALLKKDPGVLATLVRKHDLDVLLLQETKLQEQHLDDPKLSGLGKGGTVTIRNVLNDAGYDAYYSCSTGKKGYSGTAAFVRRRTAAGAAAAPPAGAKKQKTLDAFFGAGKKSRSGEGDGDDEANGAAAVANAEEAPLPIDAQLLLPEAVSYEMGVPKHDAEGRVIVLDFPLFTLCNVYVPNSGQNLERLRYRTEEWDRDWLDFMRAKREQRGVPVMWIGDLNVAHTHLEVWNDGAKHLSKQAGVTPEERASFQLQLDSGPFIDVFRRLHPAAKGHYSYWSQRAGNRGPNKGLRLDYFIADPAFFLDDSDGKSSNSDGRTYRVIARDSYMDHDQEGSDHCPVIIELEIQK